jgi:fucose 4-O-acetylase-like acetyltransferase
MSHNYRDDWIDYAKGIGILLVVYGHVIRGLIKAGLGIHLPVLNLIDAVIYGFHMPLFFFFSGLLFVQSTQRRDSRKILLNKIDTILYPYILWSLIQGSVEVALNRYTNGVVDIGSVLGLLWEPRAHFWFLYALFFIFIFCVFFKKWIDKNIALTFVAAVAISIFSPVTHIAAIDLPGHYIVFFVFGMLFKEYENYLSLNKLMMGLYFGVAAAAFIVARSTPEGGIFSHAAMLVYSFSCILLISAFCMSLNNNNLFMQKVGQASLAIYLIHVIVGSGVRIVLNKFGGVQDFYILLLISLFISIAVPMLIWKYTKNSPLQYLFRSPLEVFR